MSLSGANADKFYREVVESGTVWAIRDEGGYPTFGGTMPFWSSEKRAARIIQAVAAYSIFAPAPLTLENFVRDWLPGMERDGVLVGLNWYGERSTGYNFEPKSVGQSIAWHLKNIGRELGSHAQKTAQPS